MKKRIKRMLKFCEFCSRFKCRKHNGRKKETKTPDKDIQQYDYLPTVEDEKFGPSSKGYEDD